MTWTSSDLAGLRIAGDTSRRAERRSNARGVSPDKRGDETASVDPGARQAASTGRRVFCSHRAGLAEEFREQQALVNWCIANEDRLPALALLYAIPNGGHRSKAAAGKARAEGVKRGVPDLHLPVARGRYLTLYIEMKTRYNGCTSEQDAWHDALETEGHAVRVCYGWEAGRLVLEQYLSLTAGATLSAGER